MVGQKKHTLKIVLLGLLVCYVLGAALFSYSFTQGPNNRNVSVDTTVNITDALPEIISVIIEGGAQNITLTAGTDTFITCNATALDYNGGSTLSGSAHFFAQTVAYTDADDNNTHYTNDSCAVTGTDGIYRNFSCGFNVEYHADVGLWDCRFNTTDGFGFSVAESNTTHIDQLLALNVTTLIDYGDLAVGDTSDPQEANITNLGNWNISIEVLGYAQTLGDGLAMTCDVGSISIEHEKFNITDNGQDLSQYANLSAAYQSIPGLVIPQQTNDSQQETNSTYWVLYVPPNPFGVCNGTVVFQAQAG